MHAHGIDKVNTRGFMATPPLKSPPAIISDPSGKFLYVSDPNGFQVLAFNIQSPGDLVRVPGSPFKISKPPSRLTIDAGCKFLFASADNQVFGFTISSDGALAEAPGSPTTVRPVFTSRGNEPTGVSAVLDPGARFLFVADATNPAMYVSTVAASGGLTRVAGSPFPTGSSGTAVAVDPEGKFVFIGEAIVTAMSVNQSTGAITPAPGSPFDNGPFRSGGAPVFDAEVDPSGQFLLLADTEESKITVFSIDPATGALTNVNDSPFPVASQPIGGGSPSVVAVTQ